MLSSAEFDRLIAPMQERMVNCVWRIMHDSADTDDVIQEVLLQIWTKFAEVRRHPNPPALILCFCTHRALDHRRKMRTRETTLNDFRIRAGDAPPNSNPAFAQAEQREQILAFLRQLPAREAEAISLHALEEMSPPEISAAMGCTESTVRVLLARARQRFRSGFKPRALSGQTSATPH
ncbi:MAG: sigma-70 family RNA polymerase sigma factor [Opitutaceae bacterium]